MSDAIFIQSKEKVINCIKKYLNIDVIKVPVFYLNNIDFYKCIKHNYKLSSETYQDIKSVKERYKLLCEIIPGLYKWKDEKVYIKNEAKFDFSLLLAELLHSQSITKGKIQIRKWFSEGLIHYLEKILCDLCNLDYVESGHCDYFIIWEKIHYKYSLEVLITIIFAEDIKISIGIMKNIFHYEKDNILELSLSKILTLLENI